tara:strand:- start:4382 stop:4618 length:237 start_codon:yes stop_codon:yes gene_type:complete
MTIEVGTLVRSTPASVMDYTDNTSIYGIVLEVPVLQHNACNTLTKILWFTKRGKFEFPCIPKEFEIVDESDEYAELDD